MIQAIEFVHFRNRKDLPPILTVFNFINGGGGGRRRWQVSLEA